MAAVGTEPATPESRNPSRSAADTCVVTRANEGGITRTEFDRLRAPVCANST